MSNAIIRPIKKKDNAATAQMIRNVFYELGAPKIGTVYSDPTTNDLFSLFKTPKSTFWVIELDKKIVGCCGIYPTDGLASDCVELVKFYIEKSVRGQGFGIKLMEKCYKKARAFNYKKMYIESLPIFDKAVSMYEQQGFKHLQQALGNSGHNACNLFMLKTL